MQIHPDHMYIAPGDHHMLVVRKGSSHYLKLNQDVSENSCRPAVDPLFRSITKEFGASVLGVILTGMGQDGLLGCEGLKEAGGTVFVQDKASSVVWGMPGYVAEAGLADRVLPLSLIAPEIVKFISYRSGKRIQANAGGVA
jgi:two-component system chemotaxis response regulator CheB